MSALRILGLDPGSVRTGFALAEFEGASVKRLAIGVFQTAKSPAGRAAQLGSLARDVDLWLDRENPQAAAVETLFQHRNVRSALVLSEARGVLLAALGRRSIPVFEYSPATVKKTICGFGTAGKEQVRRALLQTVPGLAGAGLEALPLDATDALALAVCHHAHHGRLTRLGIRP